MSCKILKNYFFVLFSLLPASIIFGPAVSLINILLIDFSFILLLLYKREYNFLSNKTIKLILLLFLYLIFNSLIAQDFYLSVLRNFGFIRFGILFLAFNYFFCHNVSFNKIFIIWTFIFSILLMDTYLEIISGRNIFGYGEAYGERIVSFFKDEPIVGGYINSFYLIITGFIFCFKKYSKKYKYFILIISLIFILAILFTGERSNTIRAFMSFFTFYFLIDLFKLKQKIFSIILLFIVIGLSFISSDFLKHRYEKQLLGIISNPFKSTEEIKKNGGENLYFSHYKSGISVFKNYPLLGVGNKNYRKEVCENNYKNDIYVCDTHPHQIYFEFLSEHGLLGCIVLLLIFFKLIFSKSKIILKSKNYIQLGSFMFLVFSFIPLLPSGSFFGDYNLTLFWINLSLMYSVEKKTNIFSSN